ncbi:MAG TPA: D-sedoheptulose 7-phosphate isomerase [Candidatus Mcinerneyibacteriales bacterium]|jgi:D-sedoheptulose 7-phosphate isomerase|nr:D-sedoheptulose 7-phosphate isomerase [Candidatus Mcinerneyibacteriales bacterium]HPE19750.1 D-sedoheptulose 7-phosphate isomerase [Candidatus Mcinerneyibacteriales bacterium]HPJ70205.1 D-sedoheptulose 7-phosphate isomerase [Candidatus Mcinerneyibacteriales bacterium]HPQ89812.1 D-sedoheptulose 7-phosphate isomerase [Candidatus Mcinerneyibacteriales bacterium]
MNEMIRQRIKESMEVKEKMMSPAFVSVVEEAARAILRTYRNRKKLFLAGNGGSAADAQHLAAELVSRFYKERKGLPAEALTVNTSVMTAIGNDYDFNRIFARQIEASGTSGDLFIAISTSGNSPNIIEAIRAAREGGLTVLGMAGRGGGKMKELCDILMIIPSDITPRIQEGHILCGHILCEIVEARLTEEGLI